MSSPLTPVGVRLHLIVDILVENRVLQQLEEGRDYRLLLALTNRSGERWRLSEIGVFEVKPARLKRVEGFVAGTIKWSEIEE